MLHGTKWTLNEKKKKTEYSAQNFEICWIWYLKFAQNSLDDNGDILLDNSCDPGKSLFSKNIKILDKAYLLPGKLHKFLDYSVTDWFLILQHQEKL